MLCSSAAHCRPALAFCQAARRQPAGLPSLGQQRIALRVRAEQQPSSGSTSGEPAAAETSTPTPPPPPMRGEVAPWDRAPRQIDMAVSELLADMEENKSWCRLHFLQSFALLSCVFLHRV